MRTETCSIKSPKRPLAFDCLNIFSIIAHIRDYEEICEIDVFFDVKNDLYCVCQYVVLFLCQNQNINIMAQSTLSMRVDETLKKKFDMICDDFGFTSTAAITVFMKAVVRERKIPFEIKASSKRQINQDAWNAFIEMRAQAKEAGAQDMSLDEINAEIQEVRNER